MIYSVIITIILHFIHVNIVYIFHSLLLLLVRSVVVRAKRLNMLHKINDLLMLYVVGKIDT